MRCSLALVAVFCSVVALGQFDPKSLSYTQTGKDGSETVIWKVEPLHDVTSVPDSWAELDSMWAALKDNPHFERELGGSLFGDMVVYQNAKEKFLYPSGRLDVSEWYKKLAGLNDRTFDLHTEILKYNEASDRYAADLANYEATPVTESNRGMIEAWYQRLLAEHKRINDWLTRINSMQAALLPTAKELNDESAAITGRLEQAGEDLYELYVKVLGRVANETLIADTNAKLAEARAKIQKNNDALRNLAKVTVTVAEAEEWAKLAESEREKGQWDAILSLASVAVSEAGRQSSAAQAMTRAELRQVKQMLMYKYQIRPEDVKVILKNWVDDGKSVLTIKTRGELFEQLGGLVSLADAGDKSTRGEYLEALASCLGVFVKTPALNLLVTNVQIYLSLFNTGFTYYHSNERVKQLLKLSEDQIRGVESISKLTKKIVDEEIVPLKKQLETLRSKRTFG